MKILIIGATGFIGKHLVKKIHNHGHEIRCLVRAKTNKQNIDYLKKFDVEFFEGDLEKIETLKGIDENIDIVFYLAGGGNIHYLSEKDFSKIFDYNLNTLKNFLESINSIRKIIFFSSISAIGIHPGGVIDEKTVCGPTIPHEKCKFEAELLIKKYSSKKGYSYSILRPSIVYGEHGFGDSFNMFKMIKRGYFFMPGNGKNITPWVYVENVVNAAEMLIKKGENQTYIINHEEKISFNKIIRIVAKLLNKKVFLIHVPLLLTRPIVYIQEKIFLFFNKSPIINIYRLNSMTTDRLYSTEKIKKLGYKEKTNFNVGIERTMRWYKENGHL